MMKQLGKEEEKRKEGKRASRLFDIYGGGIPMITTIPDFKQVNRSLLAL